LIPLGIDLSSDNFRALISHRGQNKLLRLRRSHILQFHGRIELATNGLITRSKTERSDFAFPSRIDGVTRIRRYINKISGCDATRFFLNLHDPGTFNDVIPFMGIVKVRLSFASGIDLKVIDEF
jgi:hypothetical protein